MKFTTTYRDDIPAQDGGVVAGVNIELDGEVLSFSMGKTGRRSYVDPDTLFNPVNALLRNLTQEQHDALFGAYTRVDALHNLNIGLKDTVEELEDICQAIFSVITPYGIERWGVNSYTGFAIPDTILGERKPGNYPSHSSYDEKEYRALCALSTTFKLLLPVLFRFMDVFSQHYGVHMKEYRLLQLLDDELLQEAEAYTKLINFTTGVVSDSTGTPKVPMGLLTESVGSDAYPKFILSPKLIRDLALSETDVGDRGDAVNNVAAKITKGINTNAEQTMRSFEYITMVMPKDKPGIEDGNTSIREQSNTVEPYSQLYTEAYNAEARNPNLYIEFGVPKELFDAFSADFRRHKPTIDERKLVIVSILLAGRFDVEGLSNVEYTYIKNAFIVAAALAHKLGLHYIAAFIMATSETLGETVSSDIFSAINAKPDQDLLQKAQALYPTTFGGENYLDRWLPNFIKDITRNAWRQNLSNDLNPLYGVGKRFQTGKEFKNELLKLLLVSAELQNKSRVTLKG